MAGRRDELEGVLDPKGDAAQEAYDRELEEELSREELGVCPICHEALHPSGQCVACGYSDMLDVGFEDY
jgi:hypothetical protein